ncbi:MAG: hypothetical protein K940chlam7_01061, partial [Chlamydiae bacterium]|nr:hypothetical protein [Chlamydiota bacterium]
SLSKNTGLHFFITHDYLILLLTSYLLGVAPKELDVPHFLGGIALIWSEKKLTFTLNHIVYEREDPII